MDNIEEKRSKYENIKISLIECNNFSIGYSH